MNLTDEITPEWLLSIGFQADGILGYAMLLQPQLRGDEKHEPESVKLNVMQLKGRWEVELFQGSDQIALTCLPKDLRRHGLMAFMMSLGAFRGQKVETTPSRRYDIIRDMFQSMTRDDLLEHALYSQIHRMVLMGYEPPANVLDQMLDFYGDEALLYQHVVADNELSNTYMQKCNSLN